jgi:hypothetical protein
MYRLLVLGSLGALMVIAASAPAAGATTWAGSCELKGEVDMLQPYHLLPENRDYVSFASGTCTGTLNGKPYDGPAQLFNDGRMNKPMSCTTGLADNVPGWVYFGSGSPDDVDAADTTVHVYVDEWQAGTVVTGLLQGAYSGAGTALIQFTDADQAAFERCAGAGSSQIHFTMKSQTLTTMYG